jgi:hypothetical protein
MRFKAALHFKFREREAENSPEAEGTEFSGFEIALQGWRL